MTAQGAALLLSGLSIGFSLGMAVALFIYLWPISGITRNERKQARHTAANSHTVEDK